MVRKTFRKNRNNGTKALKMVKSLVKQQEVKNFDTSISDSTLARIGAVFDMTAIAQGDTSETRDGDKVFIKRVTFNWNCVAKEATSQTNASGYIRVIVVKLLEKQVAGGGGLLVTDVLESAAVVSLWNKDSGKKYQVLYNKIRFISGAVSTVAASTQKEWLLLNQRVPIGKGYVRDVTSAGSHETNGLFMIVLHSYEDEDIDFVAGVRVSYTDS